MGGSVVIWTGEERRASDLTVAGAEGSRAAAIQPTLQKGAHHFETALQASGTLLEAVNFGRKGYGSMGGLRSVVGNTPSRGVARRWYRSVAALPWDSFNPGGLYCGNVTYHSIPVDGVRCRQHRKALFRALDRALGPRGKGCWSGIWCKEFQRRRSLHYHFIIYLPWGLPAGVFMYELVREAWLRITEQDQDIWAFRYAIECSLVEDIRKVKCYELKYMGKAGRNNAKAYEKVQPAWFKNGGRWWGIVGTALQRAYEAFTVTAAEFVQVKRLLRSYVAHITSGRVRLKAYRRNYSMTVLAHGGDMVAYRDIVRWLSGQRPIVAVAAT